MALVSTLLSSLSDGASGGDTVGTGSRAVVSAAGGTLTAAATTATEMGYVSGVTSAIQTQLGTKSWELITTATPSAAASVAFTSLSSTYTAYKIEVNNLLPATDNVDLWCRTSTDNGSSYDSGASDYRWAYAVAKLDSTPGLTAVGNEADSEIVFFVGQGSGAQEVLSAELVLYNPSAAAFFCVMWKATVAGATSGEFYTVWGTSIRAAAADVDAIQLLYSSGNIASGTLKLYGIRAS